MAKTSLKAMTDEELAEERIRLDQQMGKLREQKKLIQDEVDRRQVPIVNANHIIRLGGSNG